MRSTATRAGASTVAVPKARTGIIGFDHITGGGIPRAATTLIVGGPGAGKTIFALQQLAHAAARGEPGLFVTFEEDPRRLLRNVASFGWNLPALLGAERRRRPRLAMLDARMPLDTVRAGDFDLDGLLATVSAQAGAIGARRVVLDGLDVLLDLFTDPAAARREVHRLHRWQLASGITAVLTAKTEGGEHAARYNFMHFMVDCLVHLERTFRDGVAFSTLRILKYRGSRFAANEVPFVLGGRGMQVACAAPEKLDVPASTRRVSTGVSDLDSMLAGGYFRGSVTLISGAPGTAKTTLAGAFLDAACRRGGRGLLVAFDESGREVVRNLASVNIHLAPHVRSGRLQVTAPQAQAASVDQHALAIEEMVRSHRPTVLVIDPISSLAHAGPPRAVLNACTRILRLAKERGVTTVCTSLVEHVTAEGETSRSEVSTIADTWIHLTYQALRGERNRAVTVVKSRGTAHSNQVRELVLRAAGPSLTDVYAVGGAVLMGTARWEAEQAEAADRQRARNEDLRQRRALAAAVAETNARIRVLEEELQTRRQALENLRRDNEARERQSVDGRTELRRRRGGKQ